MSPGHTCKKEKTLTGIHFNIADILRYKSMISDYNCKSEISVNNETVKIYLFETFHNVRPKSN
jgi:hypothetical protein